MPGRGFDGDPIAEMLDRFGLPCRMVGAPREYVAIVAIIHEQGITRLEGSQRSFKRTERRPGRSVSRAVIPLYRIEMQRGSRKHQCGKQKAEDPDESLRKCCMMRFQAEWIWHGGGVFGW